LSVQTQPLSLELVWIVPFRDPLIKGFGQTQKKGISIALSMANPDAT